MALTARLLGIAAALLASISSPSRVWAEETEPSSVSSSPAATAEAGRVDGATRSEVLAAEARLAAAIEKRDVILLEELLAEYYADSPNRAKRAYDKKGTLARCRDGRLPAYPLEPEAQLTRRGEIIAVEGRGKPTGAELRDDEAAAGTVPVRHLWTKKDGRWLLVAQVIG